MWPIIRRNDIIKTNHYALFFLLIFYSIFIHLGALYHIRRHCLNHPASLLLILLNGLPLLSLLTLSGILLSFLLIQSAICI